MELSERAEPMLRALGERNDIIKRIHQGLAEQRIERNVGDFALHDGDARQGGFSMANMRFATREGS